ncbi:MAG: cytochrome-c peroxidase [Flavobacteriales bacterium]|nr:cytochrome-c peroxidase [Flavobacteriales bacterium]
MMNARHVFVGAIAAILVAQGCRKDPGMEEGGQTPLVLDLPAYLADSGIVPHANWENPLTVEGVALGRRLFYEKALSDNYTMSCGSCHAQAHAFSDPRRFSIGTDGSVGRRQAMAVVNLAFDHFLFWDGRAHGLEDQAARPVVDQAEMRNTWPAVVARLRGMQEYPPLFQMAFGSDAIDSARVVQAIAQFERTMLSFDSRWDRFHYGGDASALNEQEQRGMDLFFRGGHCVDCHKAPLFADHALRNNGLDLQGDDAGYGALTGIPADHAKFKVPTLRNIEVTAPYMHDGRFNTLEEVVDFYAENVHVESALLDNHMLPWVTGEVDLDAQERADLVAFLKALTDSGFLANPAFSDPH